MIGVTDAKYLSDYKIELVFSDGKSGVVDLQQDLWGPVFEPLKDTAQFKDFVIDETFETLTWKNGADLAPEFLYEKIANN